MAGRVFITGIGIISAIGDNAQETLLSLKAGKTGIGEMKLLQSRYRGELPVGEVSHTDEELEQLAGYSGKNIPRTTLLGMVAASEAVRNSGIDNMQELRTGLISATTVGGMDKTELHYHDFFDESKTGPFLNYIQSHDCGDSSEGIARLLGISDFITTISTACSSSANSIMLGSRMIKNGLLDRVVAGGTDALSMFTLNGFNTLMILDKEWCKPFDRSRVGLNLGEGAGFVVLESEEAVSKSGKKVLAELKGYGNTNDAFHQTASSPEGKGAYMAMQKALRVAGLSAGDISYVNVHGTGTENNDLSEGRALKSLFGDNIPDFSSTKAYTGHTLGAAGGIEAVFSVLAIQNGLVYPNLNFRNRIEEFDFSPVTQLKEDQDIQHVLSNSFGFGGNNSALIFSRC